MKDLKYKNKILELSDLFIEAQRPIQILDAIKWNEETEKFLLKTKLKEMPKVDAEYYKEKSLRYDPNTKIEEFKFLIQKINSELPGNDDIKNILVRNCHEYINVIHMLKARGTKEFYHYSKELYGSTNDYLSDQKTKLYELALSLDKILYGIKANSLGTVYERNLTSEDVVNELRLKLVPFFQGENIKVKLSDGIISDASAGSDYIKIKKGSMFSKQDIHVFEVHEGWVHLGTTLNGDKQDYAKWLSKGPPCSTVTQEGLAVFTELINFALYPDRAKRINDRLVVCKMVEDGANLLEIIEYYRVQGLSEEHALKNAGRAFRGGTLDGGAPFTKDISYLKGFMQIYNFIRTEIKYGRPEIIPFLFAGKVTLPDVPVLYRLHQEGIVNAPQFLPPQIKDLNGLAVLMAFMNFFNVITQSDVDFEGNREIYKLIA